MPALTSHQSSGTTKLLFIGNSGAGKTGALASLASAGYNLRILDLDNGLDVLKNLLTSSDTGYTADAASRVQYVTITDPMRNVGGKLVPRQPTVWTRTIGMLANWVDPETKESLGPVTSWSNQDVLVIDSLSLLSTAAMNMILGMNGRLGQRPQQSDWGAAQDLVEGLIQMLYDESVKCNVIVTSHITFIGEEGNQIGYPNTLGKALPPKLGRYFNTILLARSQGQGPAIRRKILTRTSGVIELKNTAPTKVQAEYPLETGLADYFSAVRG